MADGNGSGNSRMDRIERAIGATQAQIDDVLNETRMLLRSQVAQQGLVDDWRAETKRADADARERDKVLGERIERLVIAIEMFHLRALSMHLGEFVRKQ